MNRKYVLYIMCHLIRLKDTGFEWIGEYDISADDLLSGDNRGQKIHAAKEFQKIPGYLVLLETNWQNRTSVQILKRKHYENAKKGTEKS